MTLYGVFAAMVGLATVHLLTKPMEKKITVSADANGSFSHEDRNDAYQIQAKHISSETLEIRITRRWKIIEVVGVILIMAFVIGAFVRAKNRDEILCYSVSKVKNHPLYGLYLKQDPERQFLEDHSIIREYSTWLKTRNESAEYSC